MNKIYYISYDNQFFNKSIENNIKQMGAWFNFFNNQWLLETNLDPKDIYNRLQNHQNPIRILVIEISIKSAWGWMPNDAWNWINSKITVK